MMKHVPFVENTPDNLHCTPASFMMIAKYFDSSFDMTMAEWAKICGFEPGKGTWANGALLWFVEHGYDVVHIEDFDNERYIREPQAYMVELHGEKTAQWMMEHTNVKAETERIRAIMEHGDIFQYRTATLDDMKHFLDEGYLLRLAVNSKAMRGEPGYFGHSIVGYDYDEEHMFVHDPGLPSQESLALTWEEIDHITSSPTIQNREVDAIKRRR